MPSTPAEPGATTPKAPARKPAARKPAATAAAAKTPATTKPAAPKTTAPKTTEAKTADPKAAVAPKAAAATKTAAAKAPATKSAAKPAVTKSALASEGTVSAPVAPAAIAPEAVVSEPAGTSAPVAPPAPSVPAASTPAPAAPSASASSTPPPATPRRSILDEVRKNRMGPLAAGLAVSFVVALLLSVLVPNEPGALALIVLGGLLTAAVGFTIRYLSVDRGLLTQISAFVATLVGVHIMATTGIVGGDLPFLDQLGAEGPGFNEALLLALGTPAASAGGIFGGLVAAIIVGWGPREDAEV